jgi:hypothetical protein
VSLEHADTLLLQMVLHAQQNDCEEYGLKLFSVHTSFEDFQFPQPQLLLLFRGYGRSKERI